MTVPNIKFHRNPFIWRREDTCSETNGRTEIVKRTPFVATWTCLKTLNLRAVRLPPYFALCPQHLQRGFYNERGVRALSGRNRVFKQELVWSNVSLRRVNSPHSVAAGKNPVPCKTNALCGSLLWLFVLEAPAPVSQCNTDHTAYLTGMLHRYKRMTHHT